MPRRLSRRQPKGEQLHQILVDYVGKLEPGTLLPSERVLAERFQVARMTVRTEIDQLVRAGLVTRRHGQGTFVAEPKLVQSDVLVSFSQDMRTRGLVPGSRLLSIGVEPALEAESKLLALPEEAPIVRIVRVRTADGTPFAVERASLPSERFPGLEDADLDGGASLYQLLEREYAARPHTAEQRVSAVLPERGDAALLGVPAAQPCFRIERVTRDAGGEIFEFGQSLYRGDRYDVVMHIVREET
jgi:GntR family transcriptional regulator